MPLISLFMLSSANVTKLYYFDASKWNSNESEESDEESASEEDDQNKKATAESIAPAKVSIPIAKEAKSSSSTKTLAMVDAVKVSTGDVKGRRASTKAKARTTSEGKLVVSLGVSPKFSYKTKKTYQDDSDDSVVKHGDFDDDFLEDSDDESITGMAASKMKQGQVSKSYLKRKHDPNSNELDSFGKRSRGRGVAKSTKVALELLNSDDDRHGKSESDSDIEYY